MNNNIYKDPVLKNCSGCSLCAVICPKSAIRIEINDDGFYRPQVDDKICIKCNKCNNVCPFNINEMKKSIKSYKCSKIENLKTNCSSSGIAWCISRQAFKQGFKLCGAKYNISNNKVEHFIADNEEEYIPAQGSKYLPSYTFKAFKDMFEYSQKDGKAKFLVFGTPCQIAGIRNLIKSYNLEKKILLIDFFCHGVPSYNIWNKYLEDNNIENIKEINFRDNNKNQWNDYSMYIKYSDKEFRKSARENNVFLRFFLFGIGLDKVCCDKCQFVGENSCADIRVGDIWNENVTSKENHLSSCLIYSKQGDELLISSVDNNHLEEFDKEMLILGQRILLNKQSLMDRFASWMLIKNFNHKIIFINFIVPKLIKSKILKISKEIFKQ